MLVVNLGPSFQEVTYIERDVEMKKARGVIVGIVARKPLLRLNGKGQNRMPVRYQIPSLRRTCPRAMNLLSCPTILSTNPLNTVRLAMKAAKLPSVAPTAAIGQPSGNP